MFKQRSNTVNGWCAPHSPPMAAHSLQTLQTLLLHPLRIAHEPAPFPTRCCSFAGSFGQVMLAKDEKTGQLAAIKQMVR